MAGSGMGPCPDLRRRHEEGDTAAVLWLVTAGKCAMLEAAGRTCWECSATCCAWPYFDDGFKISPRKGKARQWELMESAEEEQRETVGSCRGQSPGSPGYEDRLSP